MKYRCQCCGLVVEEIPEWRKDECPGFDQHYFENISKVAKL